MSEAWDEALGRTGFGAELFILRFRRLGLSQQAFAERFGLTLGAVKDLEQGRTQPSRAVRVLVAAISLHPSLVATAAKDVRPDLMRDAIAKRGHRWHATA